MTDVPRPLTDPSVEQARDALFAMLCTIPGGGPHDPDLTSDQWDWIECTATDHRLLPLLHRAASASRPGLWPQALVAKCANSHRAHSLRWLGWQSDMRSCSALFDEAGIAHVYLKGAALALAIYPDGGLRPLRDLDILVDPEHAEEAQVLLMDRGYAPLPGTARSISRSAYQLAALRHPERGTVIELHRALAPNELYDSEPLARTLLDTAQPHSIAGQAVPLSHPMALYAHLLLHAGVKSGFDCGPLVLADLAFLNARHPELADAFGDTARRFGLERTDLLLSRLLARHGAPSRNQRPCVADDLVEQASHLLVLPSADVRARKLARDMRKPQSSARKIFDFGRAALRPTRAKIAAATGKRVDAPLLWLSYPLWLVDRARLLLSSGSDAGLTRDAGRDLELAGWLAGQET